MDESGNGNRDQPLLIGAVVMDLEVNSIEDEIRQLHQELSARRSFKGHPGFEKFCARGFHASTDPPEIKARFTELLQRAAGFKVSLLATQQRPDNSADDRALILEMYQILVADLLLTYKDQNLLIVHIEDNEELRPLLRDLPRHATFRATIKIGRIASLPEIQVKIPKKGSVMSLAISDYVMLAASKWMRSNYTRDIKRQEFRGYREVEPAISVFYSLENGVVGNRKLDSSDPQ